MGFERNRVPSFPLLIFVIDRTIKLIEVESLCQIHDNEGETKNQIIKFLSKIWNTSWNTSFRSLQTRMIISERFEQILIRFYMKQFRFEKADTNKWIPIKFHLWWEFSWRNNTRKRREEGKKEWAHLCYIRSCVTFIEAIRRGFWIISEAISVEGFRVDEWNRFPGRHNLFGH